MPRSLPLSSQLIQSGSGFTLIELLVVIAIIGILGAVVLTAVDPNTRINESRDAQIRADLAQMRNALENYASSNNGKYPAVDDDNWWCENCTVGTWGTVKGKNNWIPQLVSRGYLKQLPTSPRNRNGTQGTASSYMYYTNPDGSEYKLLAWGTPLSGFNTGIYAPTTPYCSASLATVNTNPDGIPGHKLRPMVDPFYYTHSYSVYSPGWACRD